MYAEKATYEDDQKAAFMVWRAYEQSKDAFRDLREVTWRRNYLYYNSKHDLTMLKRAVRGEGQNYKDSIFIPTVFEQIETAAPRLTAGVLGNDDMFRVKGVLQDNEQTEASKIREWARKNQSLLNAQLVQDVRIRRELPKWVRDAEIYGTKWLFVEWDSRTWPEWKQVQQGNTTDYRFQKTGERLKSDKIKVTGLSIFDVLPDPRGTTVEDCRYIIRVARIPVDDLWAHIKATKPAKKWKVKSKKELSEFMTSSMAENATTDDYKRFLQQEVERLSTDGGDRGTVEDQRIVRILDFWEDEVHIVVAWAGSKRKTLLIEYAADGQHPYMILGKPFVKICPTPIDNEMFGIGIESVTQLAHQVNILANVRNANLMRSANNLVICNNMAGMYASQILSQPDGAFDVDGAVPLDQTIWMKDWPNVTSDLYQEQDYYHSRIQTTGGGTDLNQGQTTPGSTETARGIGMMIEQGNARFRLKVHAIGEGMADLGRAMYKIDQQYMTKPRVVRIIGKDGGDTFIDILPEMVAREYDIMFDVRPEAANRSAVEQRFINYLNIVSQWPEFNRTEAIIELGRLSDQSNPRQFINVKFNEADDENSIFRKTGRFPPANQADNHAEHIETHNEVFPDDVRKHGDAGAQEFYRHQEDHLQMGRFDLSAGAAPQGPQPQQPGMMEGQPMPGGPPGGGFPPQGPPGAQLPGQGVPGPPPGLQPGQLPPPPPPQGVQ
jgi:hypothetical protein